MTTNKNVEALDLFQFIKSKITVSNLQYYIYTLYLYFIFILYIFINPSTDEQFHNPLC